MKQSMYKNLATKYRPQNLLDLCGQEALVAVLDYSIRNNKIVHSYLLSGSHGIGKTSSARILAKTANCEQPGLSQKYIVPCEICTNCTSVTSYSHPDIVEIDAASNTGVDNVRSIIEQAEYAPMLGKYKFFIIDEAHMMSKSAFNALLKTLEEPPANVVFILATTELSKVPQTILSRCQKFNLRRLSVTEIVYILQKICATESVEFDHISLEIIATKASGSARDAISLLEQAIFVSNNQINIDSIKSILSLDVVEFAILLMCEISKSNSCANMLQDFYQQSGDLEDLLVEMMELISFLLKSSQLSANIDGVYAMYKNQISQLTAIKDIGLLTAFWQIVLASLNEMKDTPNQLATVQMCIFKMIYAINLHNKAQSIQPHQIKSQNTIVDQRVVYDLCAYLYKNKHLRLYHLLLNESMFHSLSFDNNCTTLKIFSKVVTPLLKKDLENAITMWKSAPAVVIIISQYEDSVSTLDAIKEEIRNSDKFRKIQSRLPKAKLLDVWFNLLEEYEKEWNIHEQQEAG